MATRSQVLSDIALLRQSLRRAGNPHLPLLKLQAWLPARDIVVEMLRKRGGTLREDDLIDAANPRWVLPGPQPVACR